jgi:aminopeptidase N
MSRISAPGTPEVNPKHGALTGGDPYRPGSGNGGYRVDSYDIDIDVRLATGRVEGLVVITAEATQTLSRFSLDLVGLVASKVSVNGTKASKFSQDAGKLVIRPSRPLADGAPFTVMVQYGGFPHAVGGPVGGGWTEVVTGASGNGAAASTGVSVGGSPTGASTGASTWFPCDDRPEARAAFTLRCGCDTTATVVASGTAAPVVTRNGRNRWVFTGPEPVPVGTIGLQIGRFDTLPPPERMLVVLEPLLGPLPVSGVTAVVRDAELAPLFSHSLAVVSRTDAADVGVLERLQVRGLAFQWFGMSLTPATVADSWLSSGFCRYVEWLWAEHKGGGATADELARQYASALERQNGHHDFLVSDPGPSRITDDRVSGRGALALHALRLAIGDVPFFSLLRSWVSTHRSGTVSTDDFFAHTVRSCEIPVDGLLTSWLRSEPLPALPAAAR